MTEADFIPKPYTKTLEKGSVSYQSPSNIALVKYWGKYGEQLPKNASISFTLSNCYTKTTLSYQKRSLAETSEHKDFDFEVFLDGKREESFEPKIEKFFERIEKYVPFLKDYKFKIETTNSFPHSSGIASSASGMSTLALCLLSIEKQLVSEKIPQQLFNKKASFLARLGSGSACRSIAGPLMVWGEHPDIDGSTNLFGTNYPFEVHDTFKNYQDTILLVDKGEKQVSSTVGHNLMHDHPFAEQRFKQANDNLSKLIPILKEGTISEFIKIVESEALSLHAMMMTSMPYFILMKPNTLEIINRIWNFRKETESNVCFTLDAGANVHVLYPEPEKEAVSTFIETDLKQFCKNGEYIHDHTGEGAIAL
ncbi:diphosphomevalonate/mevalonate 3,5-bisphosphate decarboxylase family protein [Marixanthomonas spongiae]|uniref:Diphosphomevalonate decarboxylase n=1 Tax=Marixanthomonas spongiae TaxID=2174845 RepID=A0A2U0I8D2_9FLAO|nr:diphosphomevalonate decarboxylase [Marixanthomonas spongiae]PVW17359.1 diphosphomevalonate decarboxylase [Marixanthomonas spongiae]